MTERIRLAEDKDIGFLKKLYAVCFPGEDTFSDFFFGEVAKVENVLMSETDGAPSGAVHMLPVKLRRGPEIIKGTYIFAAGVLPEFRSRGIMKRLLLRSFELGLGRGEEFSALITQERSLLSYYSRVGYTPEEAVSTVIRPEPFGVSRLLPEHIPEIAAIYEKSTADRFGIVRDAELWEKLMRNYTVYGSFCRDGLSSYLFGEKYGDVFTVKEYFGKDASALCAGAACAEGAQSCLAFKSPDHCIKWLGKARTDEIYFNLYYN